MATILVVDDNGPLLDCISAELTRSGHECLLAETGHEALQHLENRAPALVLLDVQLPDISGFDLLSIMKKELPEVPTIMMTAHAGVDAAVEALKEGALHYLGKPIDLDALVLLVERELRRARTASNLEAYRRAHDSLPPLIGNSDSMAALRQQIRHLDLNPKMQPGYKPCPSLLLYGEIGVGKSLVANRMHCDGTLAARPLIHIDCCHQFVDRRSADKKFQELLASLAHAAGGTLILDDIDHLPLMAQNSLAKLLASGQCRIGKESHFTELSVRVTATLRGDPSTALAAGLLSPILARRFAEFSLRVPALRERRSDIKELSEYYGKGLSADLALSADETLAWPGNILELRHLLTQSWYKAARPSRADNELPS